jgi:hypothetical protein
MVIAATASGDLRHGSVSGTHGFPQLARAAGEGDFIFHCPGVAVANMDLANVPGGSNASDTHPTNRVNVETRIELVIGAPRGVTAQVPVR